MPHEAAEALLGIPGDHTTHDTVRGLAKEISRFRNSAFSQRLISIFDRNYSGKASPRQRLISIC
jgi:hypothetical protein